MGRKLGVVGGLIAIVVLVWWWTRRGDEPRTQPAAITQRGSAAQVGIAPRAKIDPRTQATGAITITIRDEKKQPIANAQVCLSLTSNELPPAYWRTPVCGVADAQGAYTWKDLVRAEYSISANARGFRFATYAPETAKDDPWVPLAPGEHKQLELVLHPGGVEITGVVNDISGGPISHARVWVRAGMWGNGAASPAVETDDKGEFTLWVRGGALTVFADADGYVRTQRSGRAPGTFELLLTPEGSLSGTVVDARTGSPVPDVDVTAERTEYGPDGGHESERTDAKGAFRITGLAPGRYTAVVESAKGYGRSVGSTRVGLGEHVTDVIVRLHPTAKVVGKIVIAATKQVCMDGWVQLSDEERDQYFSGTVDADGTVEIVSLLPATYKVRVSCRDWIGREEYPPIVVADKDLTGLEWEVEAGAKIAGKVTLASGAPAPDVDLMLRRIGGAARSKDAWGGARTLHDGTYASSTMHPGTYRIEVVGGEGIANKDGYEVTLTTGATTTKDIVLADGGTLVGSVVDSDGKPVRDVRIEAEKIGEYDWLRWQRGEVRTDAAGAFTMTAVPAGDYRITAARSWSEGLRKPGTNDDTKQGEKVTIAVGATATIKLVVEAQSGSIKGTVVDEKGAPVADAFIAKSRESDAAGARESSAHATRWTWDEKPVLAGTDGSFTIRELAAGKYTLRAYRKGGGEALLEHVTVGTTNARLQIKATSSIAGTALFPGAKPPPQLAVSVTDLASGFERTETFFRTDGAFTIDDLPAGSFVVEATTAGGTAKRDITLAAAEHKTGIELVFEALVTITGRVVDFTTKQPVPGLHISAQQNRGGGFRFTMGDDDTKHITDESGRFTVDKVPRAKVTVQGMPRDMKGSDYQWFFSARDLTAHTETTIDVGEFTIMKRRVKQGESGGELGLKFKEQAPDTEPDKYELRVSFIEPDGPAAKTEIKVGDVITSIDGTSVVGDASMNAWTLLTAPAGTKLVLGLARGISVTITLAVPS